MKKFLLVCLCLILVFLGGSYLYYYKGVYIQLNSPEPSTFVTTEGKNILIEQDGTYVPFEIRGMDLGVGIPGHFATEFAITKQDYLRWFSQIQAMGANTIRVYTLLHDDFYNAFYEYNKDNPDPLYLIHGLWVNDYIQNSHRDAYDAKMLGALLEDSRTLVDIIHGNRMLELGRGVGSGSYHKDVSQWVLGYILGVEWEDVTVAYTDHSRPEKNSYQGKYMQTTPEATPFEALLAQVGDKLIRYETERYGDQRLVAFSNWPTTDPFDYSEEVASYFMKIAKVDVEHIQTTDQFLSGTFASYHVYPYYPDYLNYEPNAADIIQPDGSVNTYRAYLKRLADHHSIPVIISEFGIPTSRGIAQRDVNTGRNQGGMSESDQGEALVESYEDIMASGCAGSVIFSWQDEWFKRTWNTMHAVDLKNTAYWSDYQTNEQFFGLLAFDPGKEESVSYTDGNFEEWKESDKIGSQNGLTLYAKYDEKFLYLTVKGKVDETTNLILPVDTTEKSGSAFWQDSAAQFERPADFLIVLDGKENSRVLVQERYDVLAAMFAHEISQTDAYENPPAADSSNFKPIDMILQISSSINKENIGNFNEDFVRSETVETGHLTYGNANPKAADFNSLADFCYGDQGVEIKLPWQLLNFSNPSEMKIHDDYYEHYGVEEKKISTMYIGMYSGQSEPVSMAPLKLKGWGKKPTYHERLKESYYTMQKRWNPDLK